jgi:ADP-ribose pyrophosphatase
LPYDQYAEKVLLIERFRVGALGEVAGPWQIELPSGMYDPEGLSTEDRAFIEAETVARLSLMDVETISRFLASPSSTNEKVYLYCGGVVFDEAGDQHWAAGLRDEVSCHVMNREEAFEAMREGYINNAVTIIALQWLQLNYQRLQEKWR